MATDNVFVIDVAAGVAGDRPMTPDELIDRASRLAAAAARKAEEDQTELDNAAIKSIVMPLAQRAENTLITDLTSNQVLALIAILLWKAGAINPNGTVKALSEWIR
jgi:hypothetical protein